MGLSPSVMEWPVLLISFFRDFSKLEQCNLIRHNKDAACILHGGPFPIWQQTIGRLQVQVPMASARREQGRPQFHFLLKKHQLATFWVSGCPVRRWRVARTAARIKTGSMVGATRPCTISVRTRKSW